MPGWTQHKWFLSLCVAGLILAHFVLGFSGASTKSPTADEYSYIATAYLYVRTWDFRLDRTHPPLLRLWMGLPLQFMSLKMPELHRELWDTPSGNVLGYQIGWEMLLGGRNPMRKVLLAARIPILLLSCLLAFLIYCWSRELYGTGGGLVSLALYCFCPNMLAHAQLATMDVGLCLFYIAVLYAFYRFWNSQRVTTLLLTGFLLGLALAAKATALLLITVILAVLPVRLNGDGKSQWNSPVAYTKHASLLLICAGAVLLLIYAYPIKPFYYGDTLSNVFYKSLQAGGAGESVPGMPHLNYAFYLLGNYSTEGWPYYFLVCILVKTPLAVFFTLFFWLVLAKKRWYGWGDALLLGSIAILLLASAFNRVNIGLRHVLPFYPLLYVYMGRVSSLIDLRFGKYILAVLAVWYLAANAMIHPDYLTYFNEAAGGPKNGHRILDDSNIDWGQDLGQLAAIQEQYPREPFYVATNWMFHDQAFGLNASLLREDQIQNPPSGIVAVGKHWAIRHRIHSRSPEYFDWLEKYHPIADVGNSVWVFRFEKK